MATSVSQKQLRKSDVYYCLLYLFTSVLLAESKGRKTYYMIYEDIKGGLPCVRRMNATHQVGCTSEFHGNTGTVHLIQDEDAIDWLHSSAATHAPYVVVLEADVFTRPNIEKLLRSNKVNGMLVNFSNETRRSFIEDSDGFSPDRSCPNDQFGMYTESPDYNNCTKWDWNKVGDGMNFDLDFGIPVFILTEEKEYDFIKQCYHKHNNQTNDSAPIDYPLCAIQLNDFMNGVKDTPTCMWRTERTTNLESSHYCDPIGDKNVWGFVKNSNDTKNYKSLVVAAAQLDATSLFYPTMPPYFGSESVVSSLVPLLAAAEAIGRLPKDQKDALKRDIMFTFFNAESYDYVGSSRMVYDMMRGYFPNSPEDKDPPEHRLPQLNITDIAYYLELRQLGLAEGSVYYAHVDPLSQRDPTVHNETEAIIQALQNNSEAITVSPVEDKPLPPASLQQFLRTGVDIPGVLITDHDLEYKNKFYNSRYDIPFYLGIDNWENETTPMPLATELNKVATTVAKALVTLAGGKSEEVTTEVTMVNQLLYCFLVNANCTLFRSLQDEPDAKISPVGVDLYAGVHFLDNRASQSANRLLSYFLGEKTPIKKSEKDEKCKKPEDNSIYNYLYVVGPKMSAEEGECVRSIVHRTPAVSPAFINDDHTKPDWASTKYSTWTESQWANNNFAIKLFLVPSPKQEWVIFSLGVLMVLISFPLVYFIRARADIIFSA